MRLEKLKKKYSFTDENLKKIQEAVAAAEKNTDGEIALAITPSSSSYGFWELLFAVIMGLITHLALYPRCEFHRAELLAVLVQQHHHIARLEGFQYQFAFLLLLLLHAQALRVLQFRNHLHVEGGEVLCAPHIVVDGRYIMFLNGSAYYQQCNFHNLLVVLLCKNKENRYLCQSNHQ